MYKGGDEEATDIRLRFGAGTKSRRRELELTQEALADRAGLSQTYLAEVESGKRNISLVNIERLALALDLSLDELFSVYVSRR